MSALVAGSVTYTLQGKATKTESGHRNQTVKIAFGDGALTYPAGGVPLSGLSSQGFPNAVTAFLLVDSNDASGYVFKYDYETNKLRIYQSAGFTPAGTVDAPTFTGSALATHSHALSLKNAAVADGATTRVNAGTNLLGANTGSDITVAGGGANGGVAVVSAGTPAGTNSAPAFTGTAVSAGVLVELSGTAIAAQVLYANVSGY